jgi:hypothetical protein
MLRFDCLRQVAVGIAFPPRFVAGMLLTKRAADEIVRFLSHLQGSACRRGALDCRAIPRPHSLLGHQKPSWRGVDSTDHRAPHMREAN